MSFSRTFRRLTLFFYSPHSPSLFDSSFFATRMLMCLYVNDCTCSPIFVLDVSLHTSTLTSFSFLHPCALPLCHRTHFYLIDDYDGRPCGSLHEYHTTDTFVRHVGKKSGRYLSRVSPSNVRSSSPDD